jgi:hypothetical protein
MSARARVHGSYQLELGPKLRLSRGARDADAARLQRFAQHFEHPPVELGKLVLSRVKRSLSSARPVHGETTPICAVGIICVSYTHLDE